MKDRNDNIVAVKSMDFAVRIIKLAKYIREHFREYDLASQVLRSGTSIGANIREALRGQSRADFHAKMGISLREANETQYWLELFYRNGFLSESEYNSIYGDCTELCKLLMTIVRTTGKDAPIKKEEDLFPKPSKALHDGPSADLPFDI